MAESLRSAAHVACAVMISVGMAGCLGTGGDEAGDDAGVGAGGSGSGGTSGSGGGATGGGSGGGGPGGAGPGGAGPGGAGPGGAGPGGGTGGGAPTCDDGARQTQPCDEAGTRERTCEGGEWSDWGPCEGDEELCLDGERESRACGNDGMQERQCAGGTWGVWGPCAEGGDCEDGVLERVPCGVNLRGEQSRRCEGGTWGAFDACEDPDECVDGAEDEQVCGPNRLTMRTCEEGRWGEFGDCVEGPDDGCPRARVGADRVEAALGQVIILRAVEAPGIERYEWNIAMRPEGSMAMIVEAVEEEDGSGPEDDVRTAEAELLVDRPGRFVVELRVVDADGRAAPSAACQQPPAFVTVEVGGGGGDRDLVIQMTWDTPGAEEDQFQGPDADVHLLHPNGARFGDNVWDCFWQNVETNWGATLTIDDTDGVGPEEIVLDLAGGVDPGDYTVGVHYWRAPETNMGQLPSFVTLEAFEAGDLVWSNRDEPKALRATRDLWTAIALEVNGDAPVEVRALDRYEEDVDLFQN